MMHTALVSPVIQGPSTKGPPEKHQLWNACEKLVATAPKEFKVANLGSMHNHGYGGMSILNVANKCLKFGKEHKTYYIWTHEGKEFIGWPVNAPVRPPAQLCIDT